MRKEIEPHLFYWENIVTYRGVSVLGVATVLRLWAEGDIEEAINHLRDTDESGTRRCDKCAQVLSEEKGEGC
ncbi:hypothetical protein LCGC14_3142110 [marine sediment metagenome]|uniref:Uncharacterized protein n=1 Tax=marine sediment metagenome TaxID=412755 RepID=A0A0F8YKW1_9ZZZZ